MNNFKVGQRYVDPYGNEFEVSQVDASDVCFPVELEMVKYVCDVRFSLHGQPCFSSVGDLYWVQSAEDPSTDIGPEAVVSLSELRRILPFIGGDEVVCCRSYENEIGAPGWSDEMTEFIGQVGVVAIVSNPSCYIYVDFPGSSRHWAYLPHWLEFADDVYKPEPEPEYTGPFPVGTQVVCRTKPDVNGFPYWVEGMDVILGRTGEVLRAEETSLTVMFPGEEVSVFNLSPDWVESAPVRMPKPSGRIEMLPMTIHSPGSFETDCTVTSL